MALSGKFGANKEHCMQPTHNEVYISVDVETAGPIPSQYALLSIGACLVLDPSIRFYAELQPDKEAFTPEALQICGLDLATLKITGLAPRAALEQFSAWVNRHTPSGMKPVFVAFNAPFDWMFISEYFFRYLDHNPFGHKALDMKAYYMGHNHTRWDQTGYEKITKHYGIPDVLSHNALEDAVMQAQIFRTMLTEQNAFSTERNEP
jgi:ribonuclease T